MKRRTFLQLGLAAAMGNRLFAGASPSAMEDAADILARAVDGGQVTSAVLHVVGRQGAFTRAFGKGISENSMFLMGSISKPICVAALMTLFDQGKFSLDDPLTKYIPKFTGDGRDQVTMRHLMAHSSGLPDQLADNDALRKSHAQLPEFAAHAVRAPLSFAAGSRYQYSSMGILLATQVAEQLGGVSISQLVDRTVFGALAMRHSALGLGHFALEDMVRCQTEHAAPEAGGGDPTAKDWDWNSPYWRQLGAPWGGVHASAPDLARFLGEFMKGAGAVVKPATAKLMITNQNAAGVTPRGLGFNVGARAGSPGCSEKTFGHTGSTGTIFWADPATQTICVVLTSLPGAAVYPHPRDVVSERVASGGR
ncbi:MAG TPA: serine hydrolase domain-containing protein [Humisphaera sp.]|jgi:CubicO group peptidase (beta-lactamase class C family)|nr:serine hydrolase domain-containing protein [Humisphaera sp.]